MSNFGSQTVSDLEVAIPDYELFEREWLTVHPDGYGSGTPRDLCAKFARFFRARTQCLLVTVWSVDPIEERLFLVAHDAREAVVLPTTMLRIDQCRCGEAYRTKDIQFSLDVAPRQTKRTSGKLFAPLRVGATSVRTMISVPVRNIGNPHQALLLINFFPAEGSEMAITADSRHLGHQTTKQILEKTAQRFAARFEECLLDYSIRQGNRLQIALSKLSKDQVKQRFKALAIQVKEALGCGSVVVYVQQAHQDAIVQRGSYGNVLPFEASSKIKGSPAEKIYISNREALYPDLANAPGMNSSRRQLLFDRELGGPPFTWAFAPLRDLSGQPKGVIRCMNHDLRGGSIPAFTFEDLAVVEALGRAFAPHLDVILADEMRLQQMDFVAHELRVPVAAFRAVIERIQLECASKGYHLEYDHFKEIDVYTTAMSRLLTSLDLTRKGPYRVTLDPQETDFATDIIAPAKRFLAPLLIRKGFRSSQIRFDRLLSRFPRLFVDPVLMTQVVFNLVENAVKYYDGEPDGFKMSIECQTNDKWCELSFVDFGIGVPPSLRERIFELSFRGPDRRVRRERGEGVGLWYAREVVRRHGGDISVEPDRDATVFLIKLPSSLKTKPPPVLYDEDIDS